MNWIKYLAWVVFIISLIISYQTMYTVINLYLSLEDIDKWVIDKIADWLTRE